MEGGYHNSPTSTSHIKSGVSYLENDDSTDSYYRHNNNNFIHNNKNRDSNFYDNNKYSEMHKQKHRYNFIGSSKYFLTFFFLRSGSGNRKSRRHANDAIFLHLQQHEKTRKQHSLTYSSSQLSIEVSKLHAGANGRLEITCVATIPATITPLEQFADYKSVSVKGKFKFFVTKSSQLLY